LGQLGIASSLDLRVSAELPLKGMKHSAVTLTELDVQNHFAGLVLRFTMGRLFIALKNTEGAIFTDGYGNMHGFKSPGTGFKVSLDPAVSVVSGW
jgi:hypothetical protein